MYEPSKHIKICQKINCSLRALCPVIVLINVGPMIVMVSVGASMLLYHPLSSGKYRGLLGKPVSTAIMFPVNVIACNSVKLSLEKIYFIQNLIECV